MDTQNDNTPDARQLPDLLKLDYDHFKLQVWELNRQKRYGEIDDTTYMIHARGFMIIALSSLNTQQTYELLGQLMVQLKRAHDNAK